MPDQPANTGKADVAGPFEKSFPEPVKIAGRILRIRCPECSYTWSVGSEKLWGDWGGHVTCPCCGAEGRVGAREESEAAGDPR